MWHILILSSAFKNEIMHLQASLFGSLGRLWLSVGQQSPLVWHAARPALALCRLREMALAQGTAGAGPGSSQPSLAGGSGSALCGYEKASSLFRS